MTAYYSEIDPYAAQWLRNLIAKGVIAPGVVDERDIRDIRPDELQDYTQCHFFAGIGVWSYALRQAGWQDDWPIWTGSCPCQPFSAAGGKSGFADERHLWPAFFHLIEQRRPETVFGEQVASKDGLAWLDLVQLDLEGADYAVGAFDLCAAGVGAPHIRQRLFFVANSNSERCSVHTLLRQEQETNPEAAWRGETGKLADAESIGLLGRSDNEDGRRRQRASGQGRAASELEHTQRAGLEGHGRHGDDWCQSGRVGTLAGGSTAEAGAVVELGDSKCFSARWDAAASIEAKGSTLLRSVGDSAGSSSSTLRPGQTNGFWRDADWIGCTDGKWRPIEPESFPLAPRSAFDMGSGGPFAGKSRAKMLKGYGNSIVAPLAIEFIKAAMECI